MTTPTKVVRVPDSLIKRIYEYQNMRWQRDKVMLKGSRLYEEFANDAITLHDDIGSAVKRANRYKIR